MDRAATALWLELIDLIYDNDTVANEMTVHNGYRAEQPRFDSVPLGGLLRLGYNISRVKLYRANGTPHAQRLLYAVNHHISPAKIFLLGLMPRTANYEQTHPIVARALLDYDRLGIPHVPKG